MNAYIYQADLHCEKCTELIKRDFPGNYPGPGDTFDSNDYPFGPCLDGGGEADTPQHCGTCGLFLENPLTMDGELYVEEAVEACLYDRQGDPKVINQWAVFYHELQLPHCK